MRHIEFRSRFVSHNRGLHQRLGSRINAIRSQSSSRAEAGKFKVPVSTLTQSDIRVERRNWNTFPQKKSEKNHTSLTAIRSQEHLTGVKNDPEHPIPNEKRAALETMIWDTKLPTKNLRKFAYKKNQKHEKGILASATTGGTITLYKDLEMFGKLDRKSLGIEHVSTVIHEMMHNVSPLDMRNSQLYHSEEQRMMAIKNAIDFANQTAISNVFLNGYQRMLYNQLVKGEISGARWVEECNAILHEISIMNPQHVRQVELSQHNVIDSFNRIYRRSIDKVQLTSQQRDDGNWSISVVDQSLMALTGIDSIENLHRHWQDLRKKYQTISSNRQENRKIQWVVAPYQYSRRKKLLSPAA